MHYVKPITDAHKLGVEIAWIDAKRKKQKLVAIERFYRSIYENHLGLSYELLREANTVVNAFLDEMITSYRTW